MNNGVGVCGVGVVVVVLVVGVFVVKLVGGFGGVGVVLG